MSAARSVQLIDAALEDARRAFIVIRPGACANWGPIRNARVPMAVSWSGAVLRRVAPRAEWSGGLLAATLDVDMHWIYRFSIGFDQGRLLYIVDDEFKVVGTDSVSREGLRLVRAHVNAVTQ